MGSSAKRLGLALLAGAVFTALVRCGTVSVGDIEPADFDEVSCEGVTAAFSADVLPLFASKGCTASLCHGSSESPGGGLILSSGGNAALEAEIWEALRDGRVNTESVSQSPLLRKPLGYEGHEGGEVLIGASDPAFKTLYCWIASGAQNN